MSSSLYTSPLSSVLSRDPSGVDPDGGDDANRLEPTGVHLESLKLSKKQAKMQRAAEKLKNIDIATIRAAGSLKNLDVASLVGAPPPPPKTPPPKKTRRNKGSSTPQPTSVNISMHDENDEYAVENVVSGITSDFTAADFAGDSSTSGAEPKLLAPPSFEEDEKSFSMDVDDPADKMLESLTAPMQFDVQESLLQMDRKGVHITRTHAEERRRATLTMYQTNDLILDQEESMLAEQLLRPAMKTIENQRHNNAGRTSSPNGDGVTPTSEVSHKSLLSPSSQSTRPHSNKTHATEENRYQQLVLEKPSREPPAQEPPVKKSPMLGTPISATSSGSHSKKRGFSAEKKAKTDNDTSEKHEKGKEDKQKKEKRGFFKKLFRGRSKDSSSVSSKGSRSSRDTDSTNKDPQISVTATPQSSSRSDPPISFRSETPVNKILGEQLPTPTRSTGSSLVQERIKTPKPELKPVLKSSAERQYQGPLLDDTDSQDTDNFEFAPLYSVGSQSSSQKSHPKTPSIEAKKAPLPSKGLDENDEVSELPLVLSNDDTSPVVVKKPRVLSQDPPDDEHGDPPVRSGPPLLSPTSYFSHLSVSTSQEEEEQSRIESVRSRLAEVYEEHTHEESNQRISSIPSSNSQEKEDFFFNHENDEDSILTGPSFGNLQRTSKSFDPSLFHTEQDGDYGELRRSISASDAPRSTRTAKKEPYVAPMFHASGPLATPAHLSHLRVHVSGQSLDPAGESPVQFHSARGKHQSSFRDPVGDSPVAWNKAAKNSTDPVGESPLHATIPTPVASSMMDPSPIHGPSQETKQESNNFVKLIEPRNEYDLHPDPSLELTAGYISDDSSFHGAEEKKDDDDAKTETSESLSKLVLTEAKLEPTSQSGGEEMGTTNTMGTSSDNQPSDANEPVQQQELEERNDFPTNSPPESNDPPQRKAPMSKATRAALKLSKRTGKDAIKAQLDEIPTPTNETSNQEETRVGSVPLLQSPSEEDHQEQTPIEPEDNQTETEELSDVPRGSVPPRHDKSEKRPLKRMTVSPAFRAALRTPTIETQTNTSAPSSSPAPVTAANSLTVSTAAYTNAKAVAYLHHLNGEPSPRHSWHSSKKKKPEPELSPVSSFRRAKRERKKNREKNKKTTIVRRAPSPSEYGAHNFTELVVSQSTLSVDVRKETAVTTEDVTPKRSHVVKEKAPTPEEPKQKKSRPVEQLQPVTRPEKRFAAYNAKFHGRKPLKKKTVPEPEKPGQPDDSATVNPVKKEPEIKKKAPPPPIIIPGEMSMLAVKKGFLLRRNKRKDDIKTGRSTPVVITPKPKPTGRNRFNFVPAKEEEIRDPIQRAGRRLLSKAAIPIQSGARRYLARRRAVDRMWALIEIQTYFRRWICEANLQASKHSAVLIQTAYRGLQARQLVKKMQFSATQIQKIIRGYLAAAHVYDTIYYVVRVQAMIKGVVVRKMLAKQQAAAVTIQRLYRGHWSRVYLRASQNLAYFQALYRSYKARERFLQSKAAAAKLQATWRSYSARLSFQFQIVDIIIVQSIARRWAACRAVKNARQEKRSAAATKLQATWRRCAAMLEFARILSAIEIQAAWRRHTAIMAYKKILSARNIQRFCRGRLARVTHRKELAATKIQATWRGFQCYTDYIFAIVDILVVQRTMRQWLARRKLQSLKEERDAQVKAKAATVLQSNWRRHQAQKTLLYSMVHIIIAQSVVRRFLVRGKLKIARGDLDRRHKAATKIQAAWRGFWSFSHYIIVQYEIVKLQSLVRGNIARQNSSLKLGCAIIIQAMARQFLAKKKVDAIVVRDAATAAAVEELRERNACKRIQFWWRIVLDWTKEKKAALTIERFFIHVRAEVDREIRELERKKSMKKEKRKKSKRKDAEDKILENAWQNIDEENSTAPSQARSEKNNRKKNTPTNREVQSTATGQQGKAPHRTPALGMNKFPSPMGSACWAPLQQTDSTTTYTSVPTDAVRLNPSADLSEVSNITNPSTFMHMGLKTPQNGKQARDSGMGGVAELSVGDVLSPKNKNFTSPRNKDRSSISPMNDEFDIPADMDLDFSLPNDMDILKKSKSPSSRQQQQQQQQQAREKRMTTEDYIKKYGPKTAPNRTSPGQQKHFFSEDPGQNSKRRQSTGASLSGGSGAQAPLPSTTPRSSSTPRGNSGGTSKVVLTPKGYPSHGAPPSSTRVNVGISSGLPTTPRNHVMPPHGAAPSPRVSSSSSSNNNWQNAFPPVTPNSRHKKPSRRDQGSISRRETAETESQTTSSHSSYMRQQSPRSYTPESSRINGVMVMKSVPNFARSFSVEEAHETLLFGDDYGEV